MFVDNFSLAFTIAMMRSSSFSLLQVARRVGALRFATRIIPAVRWLASEWNVADAPSRIYIYIYMNEQLYQQAVDRMQTRVAQAQRRNRAASGPFWRNVGPAQSCSSRGSVGKGFSRGRGDAADGAYENSSALGAATSSHDQPVSQEANGAHRSSEEWHIEATGHSGPGIASRSVIGGLGARRFGQGPVAMRATNGGAGTKK